MYVPAQKVVLRQLRQLRQSGHSLCLGGSLGWIEIDRVGGEGGQQQRQASAGLPRPFLED